jgi:hypothetical protein
MLAHQNLLNFQKSVGFIRFWMRQLTLLDFPFHGIENRHFSAHQVWFHTHVGKPALPLMRFSPIPLHTRYMHATTPRHRMRRWGVLEQYQKHPSFLGQHDLLSPLPVSVKTRCSRLQRLFIVSHRSPIPDPAYRRRILVATLRCRWHRLWWHQSSSIASSAQ